MQHLNTVPESDLDKLPPATEREWLAASLGSGSSMLLRIENLDIPAGQSYGYVQIPLPATSMLCAANTIVASFFEGEGRFDTSYVESLPARDNIKCNYSWATAVTSYGDLILNNSRKSPSETAAASTSGIKNNVPPTGTRPLGDLPLEKMDDAKINELKDYMHIIDGIVVQPGNWQNNSNPEPAKLFTPNLAQRPVIRLKYNKNITKTTILLTGFTNRAIIAGESGFPIQDGDTSSATSNPQNGDFLGPEAFPWANKIIFSVPSSFMHYFFESNYARQIEIGDDPDNPEFGEEIIIDDSSIIDVRSSEAARYYAANDATAVLQLNITRLNTLGEGASALTLYSRRGVDGPSALYESRATGTGITKMYPVDVVVPGTIKMYTFGYEELSGMTDEAKKAKIKEASKYDVPDTTKTRLNKLENVEWGNLGFARRWADFVIFQRNTDDEYLPIANTENDGTVVTNTVGKKSTKSLAMEDEDGTAYNVSTYPTEVVSPRGDNIWWVSLIEALHKNKGIDILGTILKGVKSDMPKNYITFPNAKSAGEPLRFYISATEPTSDPNDKIPVGSIGIGWTEQK